MSAYVVYVNMCIVYLCTCACARVDPACLHSLLLYTCVCKCACVHTPASLFVCVNQHQGSKCVAYRFVFIQNDLYNIGTIYLDTRE